jgi:hypothetical protein
MPCSERVTWAARCLLPRVKWKVERARQADGKTVPFGAGEGVCVYGRYFDTSLRWICCWPLNGSFLLKICGCTGRRVAEIVRAQRLQAPFSSATQLAACRRNHNVTGLRPLQTRKRRTAVAGADSMEDARKCDAGVDVREAAQCKHEPSRAGCS